LFYNKNLFPNACSVFHTDRDYKNFNLTHNSGVLIAVHHSVSACICRYDLEQTNECVWIEIPVNDGFSLLVGNHSFSSASDNKSSENYFNFLEIKLDTQNFCVCSWGILMYLFMVGLMAFPKQLALLHQH
jgi:hypothetical protein